MAPASPCVLVYRKLTCETNYWGSPRIHKRQGFQFSRRRRERKVLPWDDIIYEAAPVIPWDSIPRQPMSLVFSNGRIWEFPLPASQLSIEAHSCTLASTLRGTPHSHLYFAGPSYLTVDVDEVDRQDCFKTHCLECQPFSVNCLDVKLMNDTKSQRP